jgi:hypothetical protein
MSKRQKCYFCGSEMRRFQPIAVLLKQHLHTLVQSWSSGTHIQAYVTKSHFTAPVIRIFYDPVPIAWTHGTGRSMWTEKITSGEAS